MKKYPEYKQLNFPDLAHEILSFWEENKIFEESIHIRKDSPTFTFYEGPPSANGTPGIHHVMARTIKDIFCRYKTQKGFQVKRKGGWDTHGLPVELKVEKELGIKKEDIGLKISVEDYNQKCREAVLLFKDEWDDLTKRMGYWVDLDDPYITFEKEYIESIWSLLKQLYDKGLLYKGYTVQPYSPAAGTGLSSHELNMPGAYQDVKDTSIVAQFKVRKNEQSAFLFDDKEEEVSILAWTTTPWTLPSNGALAVGAKIDYVKVRTFNAYTYKPISVILAKELVGRYFKEKAKNLDFADYKEGDKLIPYEIMGAAFKGSRLQEIRYEQLMPYIVTEELQEKAFRVVIGDFVTTKDGTGIVHCATLFGADDFKVTKQAGIPAVAASDEKGNPVPLVNQQGKFVDEVTDFAGKYVKAEYYDDAVRNQPGFKPTDVLIAIKLKIENKAFKVEKYEHNYPHCWRTDKPILYYPLDAWFIKTTALKDRMIELNKTINWKPATTGSGRFGDWLNNLVDWNLSRSRYWGTPLPIWATEDQEEMKCIGSMDELNTEVEKSIIAGYMQSQLPEDFDLHRPFVDKIILVSNTGRPMRREMDLIDVWFDSGAMPYAQWHYPFENQKVFKENFPADFISEGVDQTRGWFFTLHAIASLLFDEVAFKNVVSTGLVLDKNGNKMSKRSGNAINPFKTLDKYGPDATRWYMIANANPWDNLKFDLDGILEVQRKLFGTLSNTYSFFALYANLDGFDYSKPKIGMAERTESDRWIISRLNTIITEVDGAYQDYEPTKAARSIQDFVIDDLSNWYVRLNRKRYWVGDYTHDKEAAYQTLFSCLFNVAKLMAPISPFYADRLYQDLNSVCSIENIESVHLTNFPEADHQLVDRELEKRMGLAQATSSLVHSLRRKEKIRVRQPLSRIMVPVLTKEDRTRMTTVEDLITAETNIKAIEYLDDESGVFLKKVKLNFKKLGKKLGPKIKKMMRKVSDLDQTSIGEFEKTGSRSFEIDGEVVTLHIEDVEIITQDVPGWLVANDGDLTVALDVSLSDELVTEGMSREIVNRLQNLRKDKGLDVQDKISIQYSTDNQSMKNAMKEHAAYIQREVQALSISEGKDAQNLLEIDGSSMNISIHVV